MGIDAGHVGLSRGGGLHAGDCARDGRGRGLVGNGARLGSPWRAVLLPNGQWALVVEVSATQGAN